MSNLIKNSNISLQISEELEKLKLKNNVNLSKTINKINKSKIYYYGY